MSYEDKNELSEIDKLKARLLDAEDNAKQLDENLRSVIAYFANESGMDVDQPFESLDDILVKVVEAFKSNN